MNSIIAVLEAEGGEWCRPRFGATARLFPIRMRRSRRVEDTIVLVHVGRLMRGKYSLLRWRSMQHLVKTPHSGAIRERSKEKRLAR